MDARKFKSRFRKSHLTKLLNELLNEDYTSKEGTIKRFTLLKMYTFEEVVDGIKFESLVPKRDEVDSRGRHWHTVAATFTTNYKNYQGISRKIVDTEEFCEDDHWNEKTRGLCYSHSYTIQTFEGQLDNIIKYTIMTRFLKDHTAIPIYI